MKTSEAHVMKRLLTYMWRYKWVTALALAFTFLTSLLLTAIPLAARWYIDHLVDPTEAGSPVLTAFQILILYYGLFIGHARNNRTCCCLVIKGHTQPLKILENI